MLLAGKRNCYLICWNNMMKNTLLGIRDKKKVKIIYQIVIQICLMLTFPPHLEGKR